MEPLGKILLLAGALLLVAGGVLLLFSRLGFRGLPGDIVYRGEHSSFYFPIVTCIVLSVLATLVLWLWQWLSQR